MKYYNLVCELLKAVCLIAFITAITTDNLFNFIFYGVALFLSILLKETY